MVLGFNLVYTKKESHWCFGLIVRSNDHEADIIYFKSNCINIILHIKKIQLIKYLICLVYILSIFGRVFKQNY